MSIYALKSAVFGNHLFANPQLQEIAVKVAKESDKDSEGIEFPAVIDNEIEMKEFKFSFSSGEFSGIIFPTGEFDDLSLYVSGDFNTTCDDIDEIKFQDCADNFIDLTDILSAGIKVMFRELILNSEEFTNNTNKAESDHFDYADSF